MREVGGRLLQRHLIDPELGVGDAAELVDRGAAGDEVLHHLDGHRGGVGRDAERRHPVIAGEDRDPRPVEHRRVAALPGAEPGGYLLEPAERAGRLGQGCLAAGGSARRFEIGVAQLPHQATNLGERGDRLVRHGSSDGGGPTKD